MNEKEQEQSTMDLKTKIVKKFSHCGSAFYPYIEMVLRRLPKETRKRVFDEKNFQMISFGDNWGRQISFENPITNLVIINEEILKQPEFQIIHTIAHEIAHWITGKGKTGLYEKEAEELLIEWGFNKEVEAANYSTAILESEGYKIGYQWAKKNKNDPILEELREEYLDKWDKEKLSLKDWDGLFYNIDPMSILCSMGFAGSFKDKKEAEQFIEEQKGEFIPNDGSLDKGIAWGVMCFIKERKDWPRQ